MVLFGKPPYGYEQLEAHIETMCLAINNWNLNSKPLLLTSYICAGSGPPGQAKFPAAGQSVGNAIQDGESCMGWGYAQIPPSCINSLHFFMMKTGMV